MFDLGCVHVVRLEAGIRHGVALLRRIVRHSCMLPGFGTGNRRVTVTSKISRVYWKDEEMICRRAGSLLIIYMHVLGVSAESRGGGAILLASDHAE